MSSLLSGMFQLSVVRFNLHNGNNSNNNNNVGNDDNHAAYSNV